MKNERLIKCRTDARLSQAELAQIIGASQSMVAKMELNSRIPRNKAHRIELARLFDVTVEWLFYEQTETADTRGG